MSLKSTLKKAIGEQRLSDSKGQIMHYVTTVQLAGSRQPKLRYDANKVKPAYHLAEDKYHVFRGYYDLHYLSEDENRFLAHRLPKNAKDNRTTKIEIGYYDLESKAFKKVAESSAWCWQQGSRLRYHPLDQDRILFNDVEKDAYCTRVLRLSTGEESKLCRPLYDVSPDFSWGISLNYSRLQRKRPGYGYNFFYDDTLGENAPDKDGIILLDIKNNVSTLKYSLKELADIAGLSEDNEYYVNHVSISPDGGNYIFFLIYTKPGMKAWGTVLFLSDDEGLHILERNDRVSHYCWIDNEALMVTCHRENNSEYYCLYNTKDGSKRIINIGELTVDGHPSPIGSRFVTDTYPLARSLQRIRTFGIADTKAETIASLYHDYRMRGEKRCDLHPSVESGGKYISIDTTFEKGKRSILIFENLGDR